MKFYMSYEENMSFLVIPKSPKVGRKVEKIGLDSFNATIIGILKPLCPRNSKMT